MSAMQARLGRAWTRTGSSDSRLTGGRCRSCTSAAAWKAMAYSTKGGWPAQGTGRGGAGTGRQGAGSSSSDAGAPPPREYSADNNDGGSSSSGAAVDCPADVEALGRASWTLLHSMAASYPDTAPAPTQQLTGGFLAAFAQLYPCWQCAADFRAWMARPGNEPQLRSRADFGLWMCRAHNAVNAKLGKARFDCARWEERWRTGWKDGRCD